MLVIRLLRTGKKNQPFFRIVVTDKRKSATKGVYVEEVGCYSPLSKEKVLKQERIKYWLSVGAKPSFSIHNLLISEKIIDGKKIAVHKKSKKSEEEKSSSQQIPSKEVSEKKEKPVEKKPEKEKEVKSPESAVGAVKSEEKPVAEKPEKEVPKKENAKTA